MRSSETIKEMEERYRTFDRRQVSDTRQIHRFLNGMRCQHAGAGLTACINITVIPENAQRAGCQGTGSNMNNAWQQFTGHLIDIWNHQQ